MNNRNDNSGFLFVCIAVGAVFLAGYFFLKTVGGVIRLPVRETAWLLLGLIGFVGGWLYSWLTARRVAVWGWSLAAAAFPFLTPALDYWALDTVSKMIIDSSWHSGELQRAWYGENWVQVPVFFGLCGTAFLFHRRTSF